MAEELVGQHLPGFCMMTTPEERRAKSRVSREEGGVGEEDGEEDGEPQDVGLAVISRSAVRSFPCLCPFPPGGRPGSQSRRNRSSPSPSSGGGKPEGLLRVVSLSAVAVHLPVPLSPPIKRPALAGRSAQGRLVRQKPTRYDRPHYTNPRRRNQTDCLNKP